MANWVIGGLLFIAVFFAARYVWRQHRQGGCAGGCAGCPHCGGCSASEEKGDGRAAK